MPKMNPRALGPDDEVDAPCRGTGWRATQSTTPAPPGSASRGVMSRKVTPACGKSATSGDERFQVRDGVGHGRAVYPASLVRSFARRNATVDEEHEGQKEKEGFQPTLLWFVCFASFAFFVRNFGAGPTPRPGRRGRAFLRASPPAAGPRSRARSAAPARGSGPTCLPISLSVIGSWPVMPNRSRRIVRRTLVDGLQELVHRLQVVEVHHLVVRAGVVAVGHHVGDLELVAVLAARAGELRGAGVGLDGLLDDAELLVADLQPLDELLVGGGGGRSRPRWPAAPGGTLSSARPCRPGCGLAARR